MKSMEERFLKDTYLDKGTTYSSSALCKPDYQLWVKHNCVPEDAPTRSATVGFKSAIGSAWHEFCEKDNEPNVLKEVTTIKEFEGETIGGTADELVFKDGKWELRDHKTKGVYSAKKFLGVGTKSNPTPPPENEKEILQLSIYRWLFDGMFDISDKATIYLWVMGHTAREIFPEVSEVELSLYSKEKIEEYVKNKIAVSKQKKEPQKDCEKWLCDYCEVSSYCPAQKHLNKPFS